MKILDSWSEVQKALTEGHIGVMPTDTLYGVVCRVLDETAVRRLYALKAREHKPGPVIAASTAQLQRLGVPDNQLALAQKFWPGPVSIVLPHNREYLHQGLGSQPFRIPDDPNLRDLLEQTGPLLATSANQPGEPPAANLTDAQKYFGDQVDFYFDGGDLSGRPPSTIIRFAKDGSIEVLRAGALGQASLTKRES